MSTVPMGPEITLLAYTGLGDTEMFSTSLLRLSLFVSQLPEKLIRFIKSKCFAGERRKGKKKNKLGHSDNRNSSDTEQRKRLGESFW